MANRILTLGEMMDMQDELNQTTIPDWKDNLTVEDFKVAAFDEFSELLNSASWKWWKKSTSEPNHWNIKIEAIDILHFILSIYILEECEDRTTVLCDENYRSSGSLLNEDKTINRAKFFELQNAIIGSYVGFAEDMEDLLGAVWMDSNEISAVYAAKYELNHFRQEEGYKKGHYVKVQDGVEDNERLEHIVEKFLGDKNLTIDDVRAMVRSEFFTEV